MVLIEKFIHHNESLMLIYSLMLRSDVRT